jgi:multidrug efflux pump subunit AcrA (membrane-fusion protein)
MRMYDFEWLIAERMDGRRAFDEVASWARERLGIQPSAADLEDYARRLSELGFFELDTDFGARRGGNGHALGRDEDTDIPDITAEAPPIAATAVPVPVRDMDSAGREVIPLDKLKPPGNAGMATAPTAAMPAVPPPPALLDEEELPPTLPLPPRPLNAPSAPMREEHATTGSIGKPLPQPPPRSSSALSIFGLVIVVVLALGIALWFRFLGGTPTKVATVVATPREVVRLYDGAANVRRSEGQTLSFGEAGKISDIVAPGTEAKPGMPLAALESYAKIEKDLADVRDRETFYEKQLAAAKGRGDDGATRAAEAKVAEKKKLMSELEARAGKMRLVAPSAGTVTQVLVQAGADARPGAPVLKIADRHASVEFKIGAEASELKAGQSVSLQAAAGGAPFAARISRIEGGSVVVELPEDAALKPGDGLRLVKAHVPNVVPVPASALVKRESGDVVFVLSDGAVHERKVTVVDSTGSDVLVGTGLSSGDQVVTSGAEASKDGQKVAQ